MPRPTALRGFATRAASRAPAIRLLVRVAASSVWRGGTRSIAAAGSVAAGIASLTVMLALDAGTALDRAAAAERNTLTITAGAIPTPGRGRARVPSRTLSLQDAADLRADLGGVRAIVPLVESALRVRLDRITVTTSVRGVTPEYARLRGFALRGGRLIDDHDRAVRNRVAVVGAAVARRLGGDRSLVGERIRIGGVPFEIVGELAANGLSSSGSNEDDQVLVPLETAARRVLNVDFLAALLVEADDERRLRDIEADARALLRGNHELDAAAEDDFEILWPIRAGGVAAAQGELVRRIARVLSLTGLLVAGAGVLVVTSLNVADRTFEIGLRMAIGACRTDIAALFIAESCIVAAGGGAVGVAAGAIGAAVLGALTSWPVSVDAAALVLPSAAAVALGIASATAPALKAARSTPVAALGST